MELEECFFDTTDYKQTDEKIEEGIFGTVYLVEKIEDKKKYAAKILNIPTILSGRDQFKLMKESAKLKNLNHPAIVKFYGINFHSFNEPKLLQPTILTEHLPGGSLRLILDKQNIDIASDKLLNSTKKYIFLLGISSAFNFLHENGIFIQNLKPENILIDENNYPKVGNFGIWQNLSTSIYTSPELFENKEQNTPGVDVYSFSIIAYEIIAGKKAYKDFENIEELKKQIILGLRPELDENFTPKMKELLNQCWNQDIYKRPSFEEIFNKLSNDFSYLNEPIDEEEIKQYLSYLEKFDDVNKTSSKIDNSIFKSSNAKLRNREIKSFLRIIKNLAESDDNIQNVHIKSLEGNILHVACESGNLKLVKLLLSYDRFDITERTIYFLYFFIMFDILILFITFLNHLNNSWNSNIILFIEHFYNLHADLEILIL